MHSHSRNAVTISCAYIHLNEYIANILLLTNVLTVILAIDPCSHYLNSRATHSMRSQE